MTGCDFEMIAALETENALQDIKQTLMSKKLKANCCNPHTREALQTNSAALKVPSSSVASMALKVKQLAQP